MAAYNRLHGTHCSANERLLTTILRDEWGWDGVVISDWFAVHSTAEPANAGLDLEMPGPALHWGPKLAAAVGAGEVGRDVIEAKRARLATLGPPHRRRRAPAGRRGGRRGAGGGRDRSGGGGRVAGAPAQRGGAAAARPSVGRVALRRARTPIGR